MFKIKRTAQEPAVGINTLPTRLLHAPIYEKSMVTPVQKIDSETEISVLAVGRNSYSLLKTLSEGKSSTVFLAEKDGTKYILKIIHPQHKNPAGSFTDFSINEIRINLHLRRNNLTSLLLDCGYIETEKDQFLVLVFEYFSGVSFFDSLKSADFSLYYKLLAFQKILTEVASIHSVGVVHLDLKPENILLSPNSTVIVDFGIAILVSDSLFPETVGGTIGFAAPEQFITSHLDRSADVHALGAILYNAIYGTLPFDFKSDEQLPLEQQIILTYSNTPLYLPTQEHTLFTPFLEKCLHTRPNERFSDASIMIAEFDPLLSQYRELYPRKLFHTVKLRPISG